MAATLSSEAGLLENEIHTTKKTGEPSRLWHDKWNPALQNDRLREAA